MSSRQTLISVAHAILRFSGGGRINSVFRCVVARTSCEYIAIFLVVVVDDGCSVFVSTICEVVRLFVLHAAVRQHTHTLLRIGHLLKAVRPIRFFILFGDAVALSSPSLLSVVLLPASPFCICSCPHSFVCNSYIHTYYTADDTELSVAHQNNMQLHF